MSPSAVSSSSSSSSPSLPSQQQPKLGTSTAVIQTSSDSNNNGDGSSSSSHQLQQQQHQQAQNDNNNNDNIDNTSLLEMACKELEQLKETGIKHHSFPTACHEMLMNIDGNSYCVDCGTNNPQWAAIRYGALVCLKCSGMHRGLGVQVSYVRSVTMDDWSLQEVLTMLEGGNNQLKTFFTRHALCENTHDTKPGKVITSENVTLMRYKTKAALFYKQQLEKHVQNVIHSWPYRGREHSRLTKTNKKQQKQKQRPLSKANSSI